MTTLFTDTVKAGAALSACRFVTLAGVYPAGGAAAYGVTRTAAAAKDDLVPVDVIGTAQVEAGAAIAADAALMSDATGRAVTLTAGGKAPVARALTAATAAGDVIEILLVPSAGLVTAA